MGARCYAPTALSQLGSIFDPAPAAGTKGPDLRVKATVSRSELRAGRPVVVPVPDRVPYEGGSVPRHLEVGDPPGQVQLHLSDQLADGAVLRLRRQGGEHPSSGTPGDLLVELSIARAPTGAVVVAVIVAVVAAATAAAIAWLP